MLLNRCSCHSRQASETNWEPNVQKKIYLTQFIKTSAFPGPTNSHSRRIKTRQQRLTQRQRFYFVQSPTINHRRRPPQRRNSNLCFHQTATADGNEGSKRKHRRRLSEDSPNEMPAATDRTCFPRGSAVHSRRHRSRQSCCSRRRCRETPLFTMQMRLTCGSAHR